MMYRIKIIAALFVTSIILSGCFSFGGDDLEVEVKTARVFPSLPPIPKPAPLDIESWHFDIPRDVNADLVVKNISDCTKVPVEKQTPAFWRTCGEYPPLAISNLAIGLDEDNWTKYKIGQEKIKEFINQLLQRVDIVNHQRAEWRAKNMQQNTKSLQESLTDE